eukprot:PhM_4_TR7266/c0_g1_i1/m.39280/K17888/ATG10L, ATG10; ubiquitin-like-conjugating enzyme ATG10
MISSEQFSREVDAFLCATSGTHATCGGWLRKVDSVTKQPYLYRGAQPVGNNNNHSNAEDGIFMSVSVCHSPIYAVPVVYFTLSRSNGDVVRAVPEDLVGLGVLRPNIAMHSQNVWDVVGCDMHPVGGVPCFVVQPCTTHTLLGSLRRPRRDAESTDDDDEGRDTAKTMTSIEIVLRGMGSWIGIQLE